MEHIKNTVLQLMETLQAKQDKAGKDNPDAWLKRVFSKKEAAHAQCNYFKKGTLSIKVDSSVWLYYFHLHETRLLSQLTKENHLIKHIRFCLGEIEK